MLGHAARHRVRARGSRRHHPYSVVTRSGIADSNGALQGQSLSCSPHTPIPISANRQPLAQHSYKATRIARSSQYDIRDPLATSKINRRASRRWAMRSGERRDGRDMRMIASQPGKHRSQRLGPRSHAVATIGDALYTISHSLNQDARLHQSYSRSIRQKTTITVPASSRSISQGRPPRQFVVAQSIKGRFSDPRCHGSMRNSGCRPTLSCQSIALRAPESRKASSVSRAGPRCRRSVDRQPTRGPRWGWWIQDTGRPRRTRRHATCALLFCWWTLESSWLFSSMTGLATVVKLSLHVGESGCGDRI